jgi:hypothetical protein
VVVDVAGFPDFNGEQPEEMRELAARKWEEANAMWDEANAPFTAEWDRRGGWNRAYLTWDGRIHRSSECREVDEVGRYAMLPEHSGKTEEAIIAFAREYACAVCYPSVVVAFSTAKERVIDGSGDLAELLRHGVVHFGGSREQAERLEAEASSRGPHSVVRFDDLGFWVYLRAHTMAESPRRWRETTPS